MPAIRANSQRTGMTSSKLREKKVPVNLGDQEAHDESTHRALVKRPSCVHDAKSTRTRKGATMIKLWSPVNGVVKPAVARVRTHTARMGATSGNSQVIDSRICSLRLALFTRW